MTVELFDPPDLPEPYGWRQLSVGTGSRLAFLSGQTARTPSGDLVGPGDLAAQTEQAYLNVGRALASVGGTFDNVMRLNVYAVDWSLSKWDAVTEGVKRAADRLGVDLVKPTTLIGVATLAEPEFLIEVEATAILP
ncbi:RidA family protein [Actinokineospora globicatena]|uniref:RidA family protein n=1 Tax=Actinokineospora globicatena TaxID=103729 RepID=UPI0020A2B37F|nr:RidA family protein [Actinokineospora globicatena]MCP2306015.1 Enamine deaminase RidA, house cleaning of reactive enamine intermediates, YjgF/YER057c/UK114 family [Actinokineospora globicatena]GLW80113.1 enamine deaminase RidA [Actinokineospora globicatena]GLW86942.1 enamine deaminase RidA [Actinokineospora globicatena]